MLNIDIDIYIYKYIYAVSLLRKCAITCESPFPTQPPLVMPIYALKTTHLNSAWYILIAVTKSHSNTYIFFF